MRNLPYGGRFNIDILYEQLGTVILSVEGSGASIAFANEAGGHRWQRIPPNEKRGRVHTSTITVAVLPVMTDVDMHIDEDDLTWKMCRGSGAGGQHRNTTDSAVQLTHEPSGMMVRVESERSQHQNKMTALSLLRSRLAEQAEQAKSSGRNVDRKNQIGCGARGDKRRTIALQRDQVVDHITNKKMTTTRYLKGDIDHLF
jgi:peptide chain release factor 1